MTEQPVTPSRADRQQVGRPDSSPRSRIESPVRAAQRARNAAYWADAAAGWAAQADLHDQITTPWRAVAIDALDPQPGQRLLDVGCGCGGATAELAARVAPGGTVIGLDLAEAMIEQARLRFPQLAFIAADLEAVELETVDLASAGLVSVDREGAGPAAVGLLGEGLFDAVHAGMVLMLLADPIAGCAAVRRMVRPGGRLVATAFRDGRANPWLALTVLGAAPHLDPLPPLPVGDDPGPFAFAEPATVERVLGRAGFGQVRVQSHDVLLRPDVDPDRVAEWLIEIGPAGPAYRAAEPARQRSARAGVLNLIERFRGPAGDHRLPSGIWLITATAGSLDGDHLFR